jgi:biotin operon repressor
METFIKLNKELLKRKDITSTQKLIISFLQSYQINNNYWYSGEADLSEELGISKSTLKENIKSLEKKKIIFKSEDKNYIQHRFNQRKAIVLVDSNNPYPTDNTPNITSKELSNQNDTNIPQEEIKPLKSNNNEIEKQVEMKAEELDKNNEIEKQVEMKAEELDKILTERQNGDYSSTDVKNTMVEDYVTTIQGDIVLIVIEEDLVQFFNEHVIEDTDWVYKYMKKKSEYLANNNLRGRKERYENKQRDLDKVNNKN